MSCFLPLFSSSFTQLLGFFPFARRDRASPCHSPCSTSWRTSSTCAPHPAGNISDRSEDASDSFFRSVLYRFVYDSRVFAQVFFSHELPVFPGSHFCALSPVFLFGFRSSFPRLWRWRCCHFKVIDRLVLGTLWSFGF